MVRQGDENENKGENQQDTRMVVVIGGTKTDRRAGGG
jgi:hypothetical protein